MGKDIYRGRLCLGLLLADVCLLVPVAIVAGLANSAFMGGTPKGKKGPTLLYKFYCICLSIGCGI